MLISVYFNISAQVTNLNQWVNVYNNTGNYSGTISISAGTGNRVLVIGVSTTATSAVARTVTVTYGGQALTRVSGDLGIATRQHTVFYYLDEAGINAASNSTLSVTFSGGTTARNFVFWGAYDDVDQINPITDSKNYNSVSTAVTSFSFSTGLNLSNKDLGLKIVNSSRTGSTISRTLSNFATNWTARSNLSNTYIRTIIGDRIIFTATTDVSTTTMSGTSLVSMTGISLKYYVPKYFRSNVTTGNWSNLSTWQESSDGVSGWGAATKIPTTKDAQVTIQAGHTVSLTGATVTPSLIINGNLNLATNSLTGTGEFTANNGSNISITGSTNFPSGFSSFTFNNSSTVNYNGGNQNVSNVNYGNLTLSGNGTKNLPSGTSISGNLLLNGSVTSTTGAALAIGGNLEIENGCTFATGATNTWTLSVEGTTTIGGTLTLANTATKTFTGDVTINNGGIWNETGSAAINYSGSLTNNGTYTANNGTHTFSGTTKTISGSNAIAIPSLTISGTTTNSANLTVSTILAGASTFTNTGILSYGGTSITPALTATAVDNTVNYTGTGQNIKDASYYHLTISGTGTKSWPLGAARTIGGNLTINSGTELSTSNNQTLGVSGTTSVSGTLTLGGTSIKTFTGLVTIANGALWNNSGNSPVEYRGGITSASTFTAGTGIQTFTTNAQALNGTFTIPNLTVTGITLTNYNSISVSTALSGTGGLTQATNATLNIGGTSGLTTLNANALENTVNYSGGIQTVKGTNYYHLTLSGSGTKTLLASTTTIAGNFVTSGTTSVNAVTGLSINGNVTLGSGTGFNGGNYTHNISGNWTNNGATFMPSTSTLNFTGANQTISETNFNHIVLSGSGTKTLSSSATNITGNLSLSGTAIATTAASLSIGGNLSVGNGTTFTIAGFPLTVTGTTTLGGGSSGNLTINSATGAKTFTGLVTIANGATWNNSGNSPVEYRGGITSIPAFNGGTGVHTFTTNPQALNGIFTIPNLTVTGITLTNNNSISVSTALSGTGALTQAANATLNIGGTSEISNLNASAIGNTVNFNGAAQNIKNTSYQNLSLNGSGNKTFNSGTTSISGNFTSGGTATPAFNTGSLINFNGASQTIPGNNFAFSSITLSGSGTKTFLNIFSASETLTISNGIKALLANSSNNSVANLVLGGSSKIADSYGSSASDATYIDDNYFASSSGIINVVTGCNPGFWIGAVSTDWNDAANWCGNVIPSSTSNVVINSGTPFSPHIGLRGGICDNLTLNNGATLTMDGAYNLSIAGNFTNNGGTFIPSTSTVVFNGTTQTIGISNFYNLTLSGSGTKTLPSAATLINGNLTIGDGTTLNVPDYDFTVNGTTTVGGGTGGTLKFNSTSGNRILKGHVTVAAGGNWDNQINASVEFQGGITSIPEFKTGTGVGTQLFTTNNQALTGTFTLYNVSVAGVDLTNNNSLQAVSTLSGTGKLIQAQNANLYIGGSATINALDATANGNTVNYFGNTQAVYNTNYYHLTFGGQGTTINKTLYSGTTNIAGNLTIQDKVETATVTNLTIGGNLSIGNGSTLNISGYNLSITGSTTVGGGLSGAIKFNSTSGTKIFGGLVKIESGATWNNAINSALEFRGGITSVPEFTAGTASHAFSSNNQALTGTFTIPNVTVTGINLTNNKSLTVSSALSGTGALIQGENANLNLIGSYAINTLTASAAGNTVNYNGGAQTVKQTTYFNLAISNSGDKTLNSIIINNNLSINNTKALLPNGTNSSAVSLTLEGVNQDTGSWGSTSSVATNKNNTWFTVGNSGILNVNTGCSTVTWLGGTSTDWNTGANWCGGNVPTATTDIIIPSGTTYTPHIGTAGGLCKNITMESGVVLTMDGAFNLKVSGNWINNGGTFVHSTSTVTFDGTEQYLGATNFHHLILLGSGNKYLPSAATSITGNLSIGDETNVVIADNDLTITGTTTVGGGTSGRITFSSVSGSKIFAGLVNVNVGATWNNAINSDVEFRGGITSVPKFNGGKGIQSFTTNAQALTGYFTFYNVNVPSINLTNYNTLTVVEALSGNGTLTQATEATLFIGTASDIANLNATANGNTVNYFGYDQTVHTGNYHHLMLSLDGTKTMQTGTTNIAGDLTLSGKAKAATVTGLTVGGKLSVIEESVFTINSAITVNGKTTVGGGLKGSLKIESASGIKIFKGLVNVIANGTWSNNSNSAVEFQGGITALSMFEAGSGVQTFTTNAQALNGDFVMPNVTVTGIILTNKNNLTVSTALSGTGTFTQAIDATLNIGGTSGISNLSANALGNTVNYNGNNQTVKNTNYFNLTLSNTGYKTFANSLTIENNITITSPVKALLTNGTTSIAASLTFDATNQASGSWGSKSSAATNKTNIWFVAPNTGIINVNLSCAKKTWIGATSDDWNTGSNWCGGIVPTSSTDVVIPKGTTYSPMIRTTAVCNNLTIDKGAKLTMFDESELTVSGNFSNKGTFIPDASTVTFNGTSQNLGANTFYNLNLEGTGTKTYTVNEPRTANNITVNSGIELLLDGMSSLTTDGATIYGTLKNDNRSVLLKGKNIISFKENATYIHNVNGGLIPYSDWDLKSNCIITGFVDTIGGISVPTITPLQWSCVQTFGNFEWNCPNQVAHYSLAGRLYKVMGDFTATTTGTASLSFGNHGIGSTYIAGKYVQNNGYVYASGFGGADGGGWEAQPREITIGSDFVINNQTFDISRSNHAENTVSVKIAGDFTQGAGTTITETGVTTKSNITFTESPKPNFYQSASTISNTVNFIVGSGANLWMETAANPSFITGSDGDFTIESGGTLTVTSPYGITRTATGATGGNIQVTGNRSYADGNIHYIGDKPQVTGDGLFAAANMKTINPVRLVFSVPAEIAGNIDIQPSDVITSTAQHTHTATSLTLGGDTDDSGTHYEPKWGGINSILADFKIETHFDQLATGMIELLPCDENNYIWTGNVNTDWHTPANWCNNKVPVSTSDVFIRPGRNQPIISAAAVCRDLNIRRGTSVTISGSSTLHIYGDYNGFGSFTSDNGTITVEGIFTNEGAFYGNTGTLIINKTSNSENAFVNTGNFTANTGLVNFNGGLQNVLTVPKTQFYNVIIGGYGRKNISPTNFMVLNVLSMEMTGTVSHLPVYGAYATLQYNRTVDFYTEVEWPSVFFSSGGVIVRNTGKIFLTAHKTMINCPLTVFDQSELKMNAYTIASPSELRIFCGGLTAGSTISDISGTGVLTLGGNVNVNNAGKGSAGATLSCPIAIAATNRNFNVADDGTVSPDLTVSGAMSGSNFGFEKWGPGTMILSGSSTYNGATTITEGKVYLGANESIGNNSQMILNGGTFGTGMSAGFSDNVNTLLLRNNSILELGTGNHSIVYAESKDLSWSANKTLTIVGWKGEPGAGTSGTEGKIFIGNTLTSLSTSQLAQITFLINQEYYAATQLPTGEVIPVFVVYDPSLHFRSKYPLGTWKDENAWEKSVDKKTWAKSKSLPTKDYKTITVTVMKGHIMDVDQEGQAPDRKLWVNGTLRINSGGHVSTEPIYGDSSMLIYNSNNNYGRFKEWNANGEGTLGVTPGYPNNVRVSNNTVVNVNNSSKELRAMAGSLIIDNGSAMYCDYNDEQVGGCGLTVGKHVTINGSLSLSKKELGADLTLGGNFTNNGNFNSNGRAVKFRGNQNQLISGTAPQPFGIDFLVMDKSKDSYLYLDADIKSKGWSEQGDGYWAVELKDGILDLNGQTIIVGDEGHSGNINCSEGAIRGNNGSIYIKGKKSSVAPAGSLVIDERDHFFDVISYDRTGNDYVMPVTGDIEINSKIEVVEGMMHSADNLQLNSRAIGVMSADNYKNADLMVKDLIFCKTTANTAEFYKNNKNLTINGKVRTKVTFDQTAKWHFIAFPYEVKAIKRSSDGLDAVNGTGLSTGDYSLAEYDAAIRATNKSGWKNSLEKPSDPTNPMKAGKGYIINKKNVLEDLYFEGNVTGNHEMFDVSKNKSMNWTPSASNFNAGWNYIAHPFSASSVPLLKTGQFAYTYNQSRDAYKLCLYYDNPGYPSNPNLHDFSPFDAYFVKIPDNSTILLNYPGYTRPQGVPRAIDTDSEQSIPQLLALNLNVNNVQYETIIRIMPEATAAYDYLYDAPYSEPMLTNTPRNYSLIGSTMYALNSVPEVTAVPIGIKVPQPGTYKFTWDASYLNVAVSLTDKLTGAVTYMNGSNNYEFNTSVSGIINNRFELNVGKRIYTDVTTGNNKNIRIYGNSKLIRVEGTTVPSTISIFDIAGRMLFTQGVSSNRIEYEIPVPGVYLVKLVDNSETYVTKVICK